MKNIDVGTSDFNQDYVSDITPLDSHQEIIKITEMRELHDLNLQHLEDLNKTISELQSSLEKKSKEQEKIHRRLRFRLRFFTFIWLLTVLGLTAVFGWFSLRWYMQLQIQRKVAAFTPEKLEQIEKIQTSFVKLNEDTIPQLKNELEKNKKEIAEINNQITEVNTKLDKPQQAMTVLVKALQELVDSQKTQSNSVNVDKPKSTDLKPKNNSEKSPSSSPDNKKIQENN
ncbi:hypothetical protein [Mastigocoleus sp. MO_188.B34]|uniref:hypothetical protein n=1 Tax=Mastigocoleus sp. MO_188.B34 TaxID=3036635 RepID=UPI0026221D88|nr:hypothetical protein [Mastigocoleus sp. MO_188.B34]MDJ0692915.1 hypothetical protein [Mastigocoleus sp. MO_188.B34]